MLPARQAGTASADAPHHLFTSSPFGAVAAQSVGVKNELQTPLHSPSIDGSATTRSVRPTSTGSQFAGLKRNHDSLDDSESPDLADGSPSAQWAAGQGQESRIGVKRACNECRQQKLKCNVQQDPFKSCDRCQKQKIICRIDANFKRVGKRKKNAEMEQENNTLHDQLANKDAEIAMLRQQLMSGEGSQQGLARGSQLLTVPQNGDLQYPVPRRKSAVREMTEVGDAVGSMLELRNLGSPGPSNRAVYNLGNFSIDAARVTELFAIFFALYHPYLPLMNQNRGPSFFHQECPLLFWVIMATAMRKHPRHTGYLSALDDPLRKMLWSTISDVKQHYLVVKALATLCTWPLPVSTSNADPTPMLCGIMAQLAKQIGLHRPSHAQDFSRFKLDLRTDELRDRYYTWAACNIVAQRVSTGYGLPANTIYDWTLTMGEGHEVSFSLPEDVKARLKIEMFANDVSTAMYGWTLDPLGIASPERKKEVVANLDAQLNTLEIQLGSSNSINRLYLFAARLHYHLSALFDSPATDPAEYRNDLDKLWRSTCEFLNAAIHITSPTNQTGPILLYGTNYIFQMLLASGFVLLKLLNSFYARYLDREQGRQLFSKVVDNIRSMGIMTNDLPARFSEVLAQLWQIGGSGTWAISETIDDSLQLKVRSRMSMSLIHDFVWRWKELIDVESSATARDLALRKTTNPDANPIDQSLAAPFSLANSGPNSTLAPPAGINMRRSPTPVGADLGWGDLFSNDVFDPASWMMAGQLSDFPVSYENDSSNMFNS